MCVKLRFPKPWGPRRFMLQVAAGMKMLAAIMVGDGDNCRKFGCRDGALRA